MDNNQLAANLAESINNLFDCIAEMRAALKICQESGMTSTEIRDAIADSLPEEDRAGFIAQWPMLQLMFAAI